MIARTQAWRRRRAARRLDVTIRVIVAVTVAVLTLVSGAISFDHMHLLALAHHQIGWRADAFPISVDGLEMVASLVILAEHREVGKATSVLSWLALAAGTGASLAANIAVGAPHDPIGRAISGWPAIGLLVSLKLAAGRLGGPASHDGPARSARPVLVLDGPNWSEPGPLGSEDGPERPAFGPDRSDLSAQRPGHRRALAPVHPHEPDLADLVAHARRIRDQVHPEGRRLTRRELASRLRAEGRRIANDRAGTLARALTGEARRARRGPVRASSTSSTPEDLSSNPIRGADQAHDSIE